MMAEPAETETPEDLALLDRAAQLTLTGNAAHLELRKLHDEYTRFRVPRQVFSAVGKRSVDFGAEFD